GKVKGKLSFMRTVPTSRNIDLLAKLFDMPLVETPVGSKHFTSDDIVVAVEESGHIIFRLGDEVFTDSAIAEFLLSLMIAAETGKCLTQYYQENVVPDLKSVGNPLVYNRTAVSPKYVTDEFKAGLQRLRVERPQHFAEELAERLNKRVTRVDGKTDKNGILV